LDALAATFVPPIVQYRCALLKDLITDSVPSAEIVRRHVSTSGLPALQLFVRPAESGRPSAAIEPFAHEIAEILHLCHTAEDEVRVLGELCARLRRQLRAAAVALFAVEAGSLVSIARDGARPDHGIAERTIAAGITIPPNRIGDQLEAAAPIRYGGENVGALIARWTIASPYEHSRAAGFLTMAAAAIAPVVSAAMARRARAPNTAVHEILGVSSAIENLRHAIERTATAPFAVLIEGESGCGKERVARALHRSGPRRDRPFCVLNCAALPDDLVEAELFGHARGAFTGAVGERAGVFEEAHGGTLFLDEVGELSPRAQAKMLRVIQEGELRRVGENVSRRIDVRILSATNRDLREEVSNGRFRLDLLYRLDIIRLVIPPLRGRPEDIAILSDHFWRDVTMRISSRATLGTATVAALMRYDWPGNVRELQNVLASLAVRCPKRGVVPVTALPPQFAGDGRTEALNLDDARRTFEDRFVRAALARTGGHRGRAAADLGLSRQGLTKLMNRLGIRD
jgi:transcriptional regulator with GAF, ATPase, and Fis domain